jgi:hypothetical protein
MDTDPQDQFKAMLESSKQAIEDKKAAMLADINQAWEDLSQETKDWMYYRMQFYIAEKRARQGSKLQRAWRWLLAWLYQLPFFRAR